MARKRWRLSIWSSPESLRTKSRRSSTCIREIILIAKTGFGNSSKFQALALTLLTSRPPIRACNGRLWQRFLLCMQWLYGQIPRNMHTFACTAAYCILSCRIRRPRTPLGFLRDGREDTFCSTPRLTTSQVSYWSRKRPGGLSKSGSNGVITERVLSKTGLEQGLELTYKGAVCRKRVY